MTLAFLDISIWIKLVIIAHVVVSALLILVILMQRPKQEGLGAAFGSGMTDAAWGARTTDVLQRGTVYLGTLFFVFSLVLAILMGKKNAIEGKRADKDGANSEESAPEEEVVDPIETPEGVDAAAIADFAKELEEAAAKAKEGDKTLPEGTTTPPTETPDPDQPTTPPSDAPETPAESGGANTEKPDAPETSTESGGTTADPETPAEPTEPAGE